MLGNIPDIRNSLHPQPTVGMIKLASCLSRPAQTGTQSMLLRPYTITTSAMLLQGFYLVFFLAFVAHRAQPQTRPINRALALTFLAFNVLSLHNAVLTLSSDIYVDTTKVLRSAEVILTMYFGCRFIYMLLADVTDAFNQERLWFRRGFMLLFAVDALFIAARILPVLGESVPTQRPLLMETPMLLSQLWLIGLTIRAWLYAERNAGKAAGAALIWSAVVRPTARLARLLRNITLAIVLTLLFTLSFVLLVPFDTPLWARSLNEPATVLVLLIVAFSYLRYQLHNVGLELRIVVAGLVLFLSLTATLGWLVTIAFVQMELPSAPLESAIGAVSDVGFVVDAVYRPTAERLHTLLLPVFWFQLIGSVLFVVGYQLYYRLQINRSITEILYGIEQLEQGRFDYRIPIGLQDELGTIGIAFNQMAAAVLQANSALRDYQAGLEATIDARTAALEAAIEQRRAHELRAAVVDERERIARDAHDSILQNLHTIRMRLRSRRLPRLPQAALRQQLAEIAADVLGSSQELRKIINAEAVGWETLGLAQGLAVIVKRYQTAYELPIALQVDADLPPLDTVQHLAALRFVQEALSNVGRHSSASCATVSVNMDANARQLEVCIADDGVGFDVDEQSGVGRGLPNMRERAAQFGGNLTVDSRRAPAAQHGTRITLHLPIRDAAAGGAFEPEGTFARLGSQLNTARE
jgi:signal transduction histidine kinase